MHYLLNVINELMTKETGEVRFWSAAIRAICEREGNTVLDHCHETLKFRGWLCNSCNIGLGKLKDSIEMLERGIKYLKGELNE